MEHPIVLLREIQCTVPYTVPVEQPLTVRDVLALTGSVDAMARIGSGLTIGTLGGAARSSFDDDPREAGWLAREGFASLRSAASPEVCSALVRSIQRLASLQLPACFVYAFDEAWAIGEGLRDRVSTLLGRDYRLVEDVWAWQVEPGTRGWPPHRGIADATLDRNAPEILNVWVALSDAAADRSCMHAVPLDDDPGYPDALICSEAPASSVRALPSAAGDALFWNANVLHWGGQCAERAAGARVSCSFTLARSDAVGRLTELPPVRPTATLDLNSRMDGVARMIARYGTLEELPAAVREWAMLTNGLVSRFQAPP